MTFEDYKKADVLDKLSFWINLPRGQTLPPDWPNIGEWDAHIREVCSEARLEIEFLRKVCGPVSKQQFDWDRFKVRKKQGE